MKLKLIEKKQETPDVVTFIFEPEEDLTWIAGQFLHYVLHHEPTDDRGSDRWFTVSSAPFEKHIQITTKHASDKSSSFKEFLFGLDVGKEIEISAVEGDFTLENPDKEYVFIAGGIGITPFHSIIKQLDHDKKPFKINLLYANHDENIVFKKELEELASKNTGLKINYVISPQHVDEATIKQLVIPSGLPVISKAEESLAVFYVSGPEGMVDEIMKMLKGMGIKDENLKGDWFPNYKSY